MKDIKRYGQQMETKNWLHKEYQVTRQNETNNKISCIQIETCEFSHNFLIVHIFISRVKI